MTTTVPLNPASGRAGNGALPLPPTAIRALNLHRRYGDGEGAVTALRDVSLDVARGQFVAVMGPSGSGKSTLMYLLAGLDVPSSGTVSLGGQDTSELSDRRLTELRRREVGFIFQSYNLLPTLSAEENALLPLRLSGRQPDPEWVETVLGIVGVADRRHNRPPQLSGGQQQRVAVARALISRPGVLFADEPTGNLDSRSGGAVLELLRAAVDGHGQTTVMVTHDPRAAAIADRVVFLADGSVVADRLRPSETEVITEMREVTR